MTAPSPNICGEDLRPGTPGQETVAIETGESGTGTEEAGDRNPGIHDLPDATRETPHTNAGAPTGRRIRRTEANETAQARTRGETPPAVAEIGTDTRTEIETPLALGTVRGPGSRKNERINHTTRPLERTGKGQTPKIPENALGDACGQVGFHDTSLKTSTFHIDTQLDSDLALELRVFLEGRSIAVSNLCFSCIDHRPNGFHGAAALRRVWNFLCFPSSLDFLIGVETGASSLS